MCPKNLAFAIVTLLFARSVVAGDGKIHKAKNKVPGSYIVILQNSAENAEDGAAKLAKKYNGKKSFTWSAGINGFAVDLDAKDAERLASDPDVSRVEEDSFITLDTMVAQPGAPWWLDRLDQADKIAYPPLDNSYAYSSLETGSGVRIYILDVGVWWGHNEFRRNANYPPSRTPADSRVDRAPELKRIFANQSIFMASPGNFQPAFGSSQPSSCLPDVPTPNGDAFCSDCNNFASCSHGTAIASLAAGIKYGVAKNATIVDAQVFYASGASIVGRVSWVLTGLNWVAQDRRDPSYAGPYATKVVNMSFHFTNADDNYSALGQQMDALSSDPTGRIIFTCAAGNESALASSVFPAANSSSALVIGGEYVANGVDYRWLGSDYGSRVDFYAPAVNIDAAAVPADKSADTGQLNATLRSMPNCVDYHPLAPGTDCTTGTSYAAPLAAGIAACFLQSNQFQDYAWVRDLMLWYSARAPQVEGKPIIQNMIETRRRPY